MRIENAIFGIVCVVVGISIILKGWERKGQRNGGEGEWSGEEWSITVKKFATFFLYTSVAVSILLCVEFN
jgi:hypothetical protein